MKIKKVADGGDKARITRKILEGLPEWFGIPESTEEYISQSAGCDFWVAELDGEQAGFIAVRPSSEHTAEIYVMGVAKKFHRAGTGRALFEMAQRSAKEQGFEYMQVKTLGESYEDEGYAATRKFYQSVGFRKLECFKELWGCPCLIMVKKTE